MTENLGEFGQFKVDFAALRLPCSEIGCDKTAEFDVDVQVDYNEYETRGMCGEHADAHYAAEHVCGTPFCYTCDRPDQ